MAYSTIINGVSEESQVLIDMYLEKKKSGRTIMSALRRLVEETKKNDIRAINYDDYCKYVKPSGSSGGPSSLKASFIKFLFAYDYLYDRTGFKNEYWNPQDIIDDFELEKVEKEDKGFVKYLSFEQIEKLQQYLSHISEDDFDNMKLDLVFYMCFYTTLKKAGDLRLADTKTYNNGEWIINNVRYNIPNRYDALLKKMQSQLSSKLSDLHIYIDTLGNNVGIKKLTPIQVMKAREQMLMQCFECGNKYHIFKENWSSVNGKLMCNDCAKKIVENAELKKK